MYVKIRDKKNRDEETMNISVEDITLLLNRKIGSRVIGKCYGVSHTTILKYAKSKRKFETKYETKKQTYNAHIPIEEVSYFIDGYRINNGSISKMHHSRKTLENSPLLIVISNHKEPIYFRIFKDGKETQFKFYVTIEEALEKGMIQRNTYLCMDRKYKRLIKWLENINIQVVVYGKSPKRPYNSQVERLFGNISKVIYEDMEFIETLNKSQLIQYLKGLCEIYFNYNPSIFLQFLKTKQMNFTKEESVNILTVKR